MPEPKMVTVAVSPGRTVVEQPVSSVRRMKVAMGKDSFDERTVAVDMVRHAPGAVLRLPEKEAAHLIERGFVTAA